MKYQPGAIRPPTLFEFARGDYPRLPVFGRHFKNFSSKGVETEAVKFFLMKITKILTDEFPQNIEGKVIIEKARGGRFLWNRN